MIAFFSKSSKSAKDPWDPLRYTVGSSKDAVARRTVNAAGGFQPVSEEVQNLQVNPVEDLEQKFINETRGQYQYDQRNSYSVYNTDFEQCQATYPSKWVDTSKAATNELMGLNQAQRTTKEVGGGVPAYGPTLPQVSERVEYEQVHPDIYQQDFMSLSAVPSTPLGDYVDTVTGIEYTAYESAMPPPDTDHYESSHSDARNRKMDLLQGGWNQNTPRPPKVEVLEDDTYMQANRTLNSYYGDDHYGEEMRRRNIDNAERNNRYTWDDSFPEGMEDGPEFTGVPANTMGIYGTPRVRYIPWVRPQNRGLQEEPGFRSGMDPGARGLHNNPVPKTFTKFPQPRAESNYIGNVSQPTGQQVYSQVVPQNSKSGLMENPHAVRSAAGGGYGSQVYAKEGIKLRRLELLRGIYGAMSNQTGDGQGVGVASRAEPTQLRNNRELLNMHGLGAGTDDTTERVHNDWSNVQVRNETTFRYTGNSNARSMHDNALVLPEYTQLKNSREYEAMQPRQAFEVGNANDMTHMVEMQPVPPPVTF